MLIQKIKISQITPNPSNPRVIKDDKFKKLVQSIKDFPQMLEIRPIVVNDDMVVLGGNMRTYKYIYPLTKEMKELCEKLKKPYPKRVQNIDSDVPPSQEEKAVQI